MNTTDGKNVVASVLARLRNTSKSNGAPFQQVLQQYAIERFLYRISKSRHAKSVILKGALLLKTIGIPTARPTLDIDMLRTGNADKGTLIALIKDCATLEVEPDGLAFLADSVVAEEITKDSEYQGTRILMDARMDNVRLRIQVDFGVGDVIASGPRMIEYPVLLGGDTIELLAYPVETSIAEKLQAMVALGDANSRMKDFYDVWICASHLNFETGRLLKAVEATFANRETDIPTDDFEVLTTGFAERHLVQWNVFVKKMGEGTLVNRFGDVIDDLRKLAIPMFRSIALGEKIGERWRAGDGWLAD
jgi:hypothetical protein